jgi:hypothetical protein
MESPKTLPISYNESLSKDGAPLLLETLNWCALSAVIFISLMGVENQAL